MSHALGNRVSALVAHRRSNAESAVPVELLNELWRSVLARLVHRHHLAADPVGSTQSRWRDPACQQALAWAFLDEEVLRLAGASGGVDEALLMHRAKKWVWRQHRRQDPLGARAYQALGGAVRTLLAAGCPVVARRTSTARPAHWLRDAILPAAPRAAGDLVSPADLDALLDCGGWHRGVARAGKRGLRTWIEQWLPSLPSLWPRASWPGCTAKDILSVLVTRMRGDATRTTSIASGDDSLDFVDRTPDPAPTSIAVGAIDGWLARRLITLENALQPQSTRHLYAAIRREILGRTNRPRHKRCTRLALWMLGRARDRFAAEVAELSNGLSGAERRLAVVRAAAEQLQVILQEWPTETTLSVDFYRPRIQRGLFRPVARVQQTEDRDAVRQSLLHYLGNELR